jgi:NAD(P)-dependent dehydrogenase (short-subunit alcohol dehydrogenase family)
MPIAVVGTVEELATSPRTLALIRDQFETNYFGPVNIIKAILPAMRKNGSGHIIILSSIGTFTSSDPERATNMATSRPYRDPRLGYVLCLYPRT